MSFYLLWRVLRAALLDRQFPAAVVELPLGLDGFAGHLIELRRELRLRLDVVHGELPAALLEFLRRRGVFRFQNLVLRLRRAQRVQRAAAQLVEALL